MAEQPSSPPPLRRGQDQAGHPAKAPRPDKQQRQDKRKEQRQAARREERRDDRREDRGENRPATPGQQPR